jgi:hypothetical protein
MRFESQRVCLCLLKCARVRYHSTQCFQGPSKSKNAIQKRTVKSDEKMHLNYFCFVFFSPASSFRSRNNEHLNEWRRKGFKKMYLPLLSARGRGREGKKPQKLFLSSLSLPLASSNKNERTARLNQEMRREKDCERASVWKRE